MEPSPWGNVFLGQLTGHKTETARAGFNPRPAGLFQTGSATQAVNDFLCAHAGKFYTMEQLRFATGRTNKSLDWACRFLCSIGRLEWRADASRNPRYRRYTARVQVTDEGDRP